MLQALFVYGTLAPGKGHEHFLRPLPGHWQDAAIRGWHFPEGLKPTRGYPVVYLDDDYLGDRAEKIPGKIFFSRRLDSIWKKLDEFEGEGYTRVVTRARLKSGSCVDAYVYALDDKYHLLARKFLQM